MAKPKYAIVVMKCETLNSFLADTFLMMKEGTTIFGKKDKIIVWNLADLADI